MANKDYTLAESITLFIGDFEFDAIRLITTGEYRMAQEQITEPIEIEKGWFNRLCKRGGVSLKALQRLDLDWLCESKVLPVKYKKNGKTVYALSRSLEDADGCWEYHATNGNRIARLIGRALRQDSLRDRFDQIYGRARVSQEERRQRDNRVLKQPFKWEKLYEKEMCDKIQKWYGFDSSKFYWWYIYNFLTPEERAQLDAHNPVLTVVSKSGNKRTARKNKIHQHFSKMTYKRLTDFAEYLWKCIEFCDSRVEFEKKWNKKYGQPTQLEIFDLWDFAS